MNTFRVTVSVTGTDDQGNERSFTGTGTIYAQQALDNTIELGTTPELMTDQGVPMYAYIENLGTVDVAYAVERGVGETYTSLVVPPGGSAFVSLVGCPTDATAMAGSLYAWAQSGTADIRLILFY